MEVVGAGCNTDTGPTSCDVTVGTQFTVKASLDDLDGLPSGYMGFQIRLNHSPGLTRQDRPSQVVVNDNQWLLAENLAQAIDTDGDTILDARAGRAITATVAAAL